MKGDSNMAEKQFLTKKGYEESERNRSEGDYAGKSVLRAVRKVKVFKENI